MAKKITTHFKNNAAPDPAAPFRNDTHSKNSMSHPLKGVPIWETELSGPIGK